MQPLVNIAIQAARQAGQLIVRALDQSTPIEHTSKGKNDYVTEIDRRAEQAIISTISEFFPSHSFLGEESGHHPGSEYRWIIDPLDGTNNFIHKVPHFAVSIALEHKGKLEIGVIYDPLRHELFIASRGNGARINDRRIRVSTQLKLEHSLIATGFPYRQDQPLDVYVAGFTAMMEAASGLRRAGSAALDLAYVAAGRFDGFWEMGLKYWDIAAGALLIQEAGGLIADLQGGHTFAETGNVVAGNPKVFKALLQTLHPTLPKGFA